MTEKFTMAKASFNLKIEDSKVSERDAIWKLHDMLKGKGLYLSELFTTEFCSWVEMRIADDVLPDIFEELQGRIKDAVKLEDSLRNASEMASVEKQRDAKVIADLTDKIEHQKDFIETYKESLEARSEMIHALENSKTEADKKIATITAQYKILQEQIRDLKAKLYDLQNEPKPHQLG